MAIPFHPPPPDELQLRRLQELVEELYVLIVCHLINNPAKPSEQPPKRRGPSCTEDDKSQQNLKRDGGDSDSDPDACAATTTAATADAVFAEVAADLDLVQQRRLPVDLVAPLKPLPDATAADLDLVQRRRLPVDLVALKSLPDATDLLHQEKLLEATSPCKCSCQGRNLQGKESPEWRKVGDDLREVADTYSDDPKNGPTSESQGSPGFLPSVLGYQTFGLPVWMTTIACVIGYRLFCGSA